MRLLTNINVWAADARRSSARGRSTVSLETKQLARFLILLATRHLGFHHFPAIFIRVQAVHTLRPDGGESIAYS